AATTSIPRRPPLAPTRSTRPRRRSRSRASTLAPRARRRMAISLARAGADPLCMRRMARAGMGSRLAMGSRMVRRAGMARLRSRHSPGG
ncbi:hypothetical protein AOQ84DRAFT_219765, partial [Glonium stellatum]